MFNSKTFSSFVIVLFSLLPFLIFGQTQDQIILFQIPSSSTQIEAAEQAGQHEVAKDFMRWDNQIKNAIFLDFSENYSFGPVYFFATEDADKIKKQDFSNVVFFNRSGENTQLPSNLGDYQIANISFYPKETIVKSKDGKDIIEESPENHTGQGIILRNKNYEPVTGKLRFTPCRIAKRGNIFKPKKRYYVFKGSSAFSDKLKKFQEE
jgi:hypothetical protein